MTLFWPILDPPMCHLVTLARTRRAPVCRDNFNFIENIPFEVKFSSKTDEKMTRDTWV